MSATWSNNPNAPRISHGIYSLEKLGFVGSVVAAILHGTIIALFFQCMTALLSPKNHMRGAGRWALVVHTVALFSFTTMSLATVLFFLPIAYIDAREFPGVDGLPYGPIGYLSLPKFTVIASVSGSAIQVNQWLVDGLLLYRCYVIYGMSYWAIAFPFMIYLASFATGIAFIYEAEQTSGSLLVDLNLGDAYYSIALSLNVLLTLMLVTRLVLHSKNIRRAMGGQDGASGLYKRIITMLVESGALYAASFAIVVGPWASGNTGVRTVTDQMLPEVQCIAPFLIVLRVANRTALTSEAVASGTIGSIRFRSQGQSTGGDGSLSNGNPIHSAPDAHGESPGERDTGTENAIEEVPL